MWIVKNYKESNDDDDDDLSTGIIVLIVVLSTIVAVSIGIIGYKVHIKRAKP